MATTTDYSYLRQGSFGHTKYWVNAYDTQEAYGGPEEGGWWFEEGVPTGESWGPVYGLDAAHRLLDSLLDREAARNEGRYPRWSVLSDGWYRLSVEEHEPRAYPEQRPQYC